MEVRRRDLRRHRLGGRCAHGHREVRYQHGLPEFIPLLQPQKGACCAPHDALLLGVASDVRRHPWPAHQPRLVLDRDPPRRLCLRAARRAGLVREALEQEAVSTVDQVHRFMQEFVSVRSAMMFKFHDVLQRQGDAVAL